MRNVEPERLQPAEWIVREGAARFRAALIVMAENQVAALSAVSGSCAELIVEFTVSLNNRQDVEVLINKIKNHTHIHEVRRSSN